MALSIKSDTADQLARQLAAETGESITEAVTTAIQDRLARERRSRRNLAQTVMEISHECAALPVLDDRPADEIVGYDEHGVPA
jgi:antitoxin VapB